MSREKPLVLIVDDNWSVISSLSSLLEARGFEVDTSLNGSDALRKILQKPYDAVVCDVEMPQMSGLDFLSKVRKDGHNVDVILMTGYLEADYFVHAIKLGASDFISKPVEAAQLEKSIRDIITKKESRQGLGDLFRQLDATHITFVIDPRRVLQRSIAQGINKFMQKHVLISSDAMTEILTCIDEMLHNAYIHGTLGLTPEQRLSDNAVLQAVIRDKLNQPEIANRRVTITLSIDQLEDAITITVADQGKGFDFEPWLTRLSEGHQLTLDEHGRGLAVLYHLSDSLQFLDGGRQVQITRKLNQRQSSQI